MPVAIRELTSEDAEAYFEHRRDALRNEPLAFASSPEDDIASSPEVVRVLLSRAPDSVVFGAFAAGLVGSVGVIRDRHVKCAHKVQLFGMYVEPQSRRDSIGRDLLEAAIQHARSLDGVCHVHLGVGGTAKAAHRLYETFGFKTWGTEPDAIRDLETAVAVHHMVLDVDQGAT